MKKALVRGSPRSGFALALAILILIGILSYANNRSLVANEDAVFRSQEVINRLDQLLVEMLGAESAVRAYLVAGRAFRLESLDEATRKVEDTFSALRVLLGNDPRQQQWLERLGQPVREKLAFHYRMVELRDTSGEESARRLFLTGRGHDLMDDIRSRVAAKKAEEDRVLRDRTAAARMRSKWSVLILVLGSLLSFTILLAVYLSLEREIARRRKAVEGLRQSEEKYRRIVETASEGVWIIDPRNVTTFVNQELAAMLGHPADELIGKSLFDLLPVEEAGILAAENAAPRTPGAGEHLDFQLRRSDGRDLWAYVRTSAVMENGRYLGIMAMLTDITERKRAEQEVLRLNQDLERRVAERTNQLRRTAAELEKRNLDVERVNRMKTEFLARMSHELRTPLNAIVGYSELLGEQSSGALPAPYPRFVANIQEGGRHLLAMVNDLLDISKIEAGRMELNREVFRAAEALGEVLSVITPLANIKSIQIENQVPAGMCVRADRMRFKQVLYNLLSNAVKFTPENGRVWIAECSLEDAAGISVGDTGIGIPAADLESVFDEFHQVSDPSGAAREGTGLGLSITRRLVELHGGSIHVESTVGQGSRFMVSLGAFSLEQPTALTAERS